MHQHPAACRGIEPSKVQNRLRLACAKEIPAPVNPCLNPRMVVVGMRPTRSIDLTRRYAHGAESGDKKRRFLAATPVCCTDSGKRRACTCVRWLIVGLLVTPVVHLQYRVVHRQAFQPRHQLIVKHHTRAVEILVVDTHRQHEVAENIVGNRPAPNRLATCSQRAAHIF